MRFKALFFSLFPFCLSLFLVACAYGQIKTQKDPDTFPVDRAREDGDWTLLYRDVPLEISRDGYVIFMIPSDWTPSGLKDSDQLKISRSIEKDRSILTLERVKP